MGTVSMVCCSNQCHLDYKECGFSLGDGEDPLEGGGGPINIGSIENKETQIGNGEKYRGEMKLIRNEQLIDIWV